MRLLPGYTFIATLFILTGCTITALPDKETEAAAQQQIAVPVKNTQRTAKECDDIAIQRIKYGKYDQATTWYLEALSIREKTLGTDHLETVATYDRLAWVSLSKGDYEKTLEWYQKALSIRERSSSRKGLYDRLVTSENIARVYHRWGKWNKALEWYKKTVELRKISQGKEHPNTIADYHRIAAIYHSQNDFRNALVWYKKELAIQEKRLGKNHPTVAGIYGDIANVYFGRGSYEQALSENLIAYKILVKKSGVLHRDSGKVKVNMKEVYQHTARAKPFDDWLSENMH
ncbi:MAG: tetratricopeptide repeat protein [Betaproteobacteria bacterium]|jgi:tetratricopeptide (TPR) repeat protein|nr:tetratricopeptide repeat protein [Betaproteobacteria bacterium]